MRKTYAALEYEMTELPRTDITMRTNFAEACLRS